MLGEDPVAGDSPASEDPSETGGRVLTPAPSGLCCMTANQIVAYNVIKARALRGWTQDRAAEALAPYIGAKLSGPSFSALERSASKYDRIRQFSADDLVALSRGFDLPIGYFFTPPPPETDVDADGDSPDGRIPGLDPLVLLDAILGTPDNLGCWMDDLRAYSAGASVADLSDRLTPIVGLRSRALLRHGLGHLDPIADLLERLAEALQEALGSADSPRQPEALVDVPPSS